MRYLLHFPVILFFLISLALEAQTDVSIRKKDFKTDKSGFAEAWKHVNDGDSYYSDKGVWYGSAFDEYIKAIVYNNSNAELNYKTGVSALYSDKKEEAAGFLLKGLELKKDVAPDILILTGRALQYNGAFPEAVEKYNSYLNSPGKKPKEDVALAKKCIEECNYGLTVTKDTLRIGIDNMGAIINSNADDYSEIFTADGKTLYFGSRREHQESGKRYSDTKFEENIFISHQNGNSWNLATIAGKDLTTSLCETPLFINAAGDRLYIYAGYDNGGDIKMSVFKKDKWKAPEPVPYSINSKGSETSFCFNPAGNEIYFVTDNGKDNLGGKDIYFIKKMTGNRWSKPHNAGSIINTAFDEESVRFSSSGDTLWFSSKGHNSIGGFDVFYSIKNKAGDWDTVKNYGYPVNTPWDEMFYYPSPVEDSAFYFVSNRSGGFGGLDIYRGHIIPPEPVVIIIPPVRDTVVIRDTIVIIKEIVPVAPAVQAEPGKEPDLYLTGKIKDAETGAPVMARIAVTDIATDSVSAITASSDTDGSYRVRLHANKTYMIDLHAAGFLPETKEITVPEKYYRETFNLDVVLIKVKVGKKVVLNNILFETGKSILTPGSYTELERLLNIMNDNELMKIEISGHTDRTGSEPVNAKLSEARAKSVVEYLVQNGVDRSRLEFKGYGSSQPIADNATSPGRAKNRRVEFKILEF